MLQIDRSIMPEWVEELYKEFNSLNPENSALAWNWEGGKTGCFLSVIYVETKSGQRLLIGTRNHESNVHLTDGNISEYLRKINSLDYIPCGYELSSFHEFDTNKSLFDNLLCWFGKYKDETNERVLSDYGQALYDWLKPHYSGDIALSMFTQRLDNFEDYILFRHPEKYKEYRKVTSYSGDSVEEEFCNTMLSRGFQDPNQKYVYKFDSADETWNHIQNLLKHYTLIEGNGQETWKYITKMVHSFIGRIINISEFEVICNETNNPPSVFDEDDLNIYVRWRHDNERSISYYENTVSRNEYKKELNLTV